LKLRRVLGTLRALRRVSRETWSRSAVLGARLLLTVLVFARTGSAADGEERSGAPVRFHLSYAADEGCPTEAEFRHGVEIRALRAQATDAAHASVGLAVTLRREGERTAGVLVVTLPDGTSSERRVSDTSCEAAAASLAVMSALGLDALLPATRPTINEPTKPPEPSAPAAMAPAPAASSVTRTAEARPVAARGSKRGVDVRAHAHVFWESAIAPQVPFGVLAGGEVSSRGAGVFAPSAALTALVTLTGRATTSAGSADFRLLAARFTGCPLRPGRFAGASLRTCFEFDAGALRATPDETVRNHTPRTMPWLAAGLGLRGQVPLDAGLALEVAATGRALFRHDAFVIRPGLPVHDVPPLSVGVSLGLSYGF
jgi:hypothetical protein